MKPKAVTCGSWKKACSTQGRDCTGVIGPFFALFIAYPVRIAVEERALHDHFGTDFEAHKKRTWAVIPLVW